MIKDNIKVQIILIILFTILLILPYKSYVNKKVYDPKSNYQVLKKLNRNDTILRDDILIVYDKDFKVDFYNFKIEPIYIKNLDSLIYLENYEKDLIYHEEEYTSYVFITKDDKLYYYQSRKIEEINPKNFSSFIDKEIYSNDAIYKKKIYPFIPKLQTPKEFYNNFKEYFFPYYLGDYEVK